jgi:hypothetical protein
MRCLRRSTPVVLVTVLLSAACGDDPAGPALGDELVLNLEGMGAVPAEMGALHIWSYQGADTVHAGVLPAGDGGDIPAFRFTAPQDRPEGILVSLEVSPSPPAAPGPSLVVGGTFSGSTAQLGLERMISDGRPLQPRPGAHSLFTTSNNSEGYPSAENAGLWLFTLTPLANDHETREVKVTPLRRGWTYEGWIVKRGSPEIWISYGKFRPDEFSLLTSRDDSGSGPFAGTEDFRNAGVEDVPGEEWTSTEIADQLGISLPAGLTVPLELDEVDDQGNAVWRHVITIEPARDLVEGPLEGRPFTIRPYENDIGAGGPGVPRTIRQVSAGPSGSVRPAAS